MASFQQRTDLGLPGFDASRRRRSGLPLPSNRTLPVDTCNFHETYLLEPYFLLYPTGNALSFFRCAARKAALRTACQASRLFGLTSSVTYWQHTYEGQAWMAKRYALATSSSALFRKHSLPSAACYIIAGLGQLRNPILPVRPPTARGLPTRPWGESAYSE